MLNDSQEDEGPKLQIRLSSVLHHAVNLLLSVQQQQSSSPSDLNGTSDHEGMRREFGAFTSTSLTTTTTTTSKSLATTSYKFAPAPTDLSLPIGSNNETAATAAAGGSSSGSSNLISGLFAALLSDMASVSEDDGGGGERTEILRREEMRDLVSASSDVPIEYTMTLWGYLMPFLLILTIVANTLIVLVLSRKHMITPTNIVLLAMAISDLLTMLFPAPWYFYMYTLGNHTRVLSPTSACYAFHVMIEVIPAFFHTASIWLTLLLATQRYVYVCHPTLATSWCTGQSPDSHSKFGERL